MMIRTLLVCMLLCISSHPLQASSAGCQGEAINPVTDICWSCLLPIQIGAVSHGGTPAGATPDPVCLCPNGSGGISIGLTVSFFEHARLVEAVREPFCFPALGTGLSLNDPTHLTGVSRSSSHGDSSLGFMQLHYYRFPAWQMLGLLTDLPCMEQSPFDLAYLSEVDPLWNDDLLSHLVNPEALLFANPVTQLSCMADSAAVSIGTPLDQLFWCLGSWGSTYPLSGSMAESDPITLSAGLTARLLFKLGREGVLPDTASNSCARQGVYMPLLLKGNYRLQPVRPVVRHEAIPIGRSPLVWGSGLNPPLGLTGRSPDNFLYAITRRRLCCVGPSL
ncbi:MAG: TraU family protein [Trichlorobacter sp.]